MKKPAVTASTLAHIVFARFAERRCGRADFHDLADRLKSANVELLAKSRAVEDAEYPQFDAVGDRDEVGGDLLQTVRNLRAQLVARDSEAGIEGSQGLFGKVLPDGMEPFDSIKLGQHKVLYGAVIENLEDALPPEDGLRIKTSERLTSMLGDWDAALDLVDEARKLMLLARQEKERAIASWDEAVEFVYGALITRVGKVKAERFFPKSRLRKDDEPADESLVGTEPAPG